MSNAIRFEAEKNGFRLDAATARRQFWLSLGAGLAVLVVAAMIDLQPPRAAADAPSARIGQVVAPEFVAAASGLAQLRQAMAADAQRDAD